MHLTWRFCQVLLAGHLVRLRSALGASAVPIRVERSCCEVVLMVAETWVVPLIFNILQFNEEDWSFWSSGAEDVA